MFRMVQRYVETERRRNRRIVVWVSTIFLLIVSLVLTAFVSVGLVVLRRSRAAAELAEETRARTAAYAAEVVSLAERVAGTEQRAAAAQASLNDAEVRRLRQDQVLKGDLQRFSAWIASLQNEDRTRLSRLEEQLRTLMGRLEGVAPGEGLEPSPARRSEGEGSPPRGPLPPGDEPRSLPSAASRLGQSQGTGSSLAATSSVRREVRTVVLANGDRYEGQVLDGLFDGWGVYVGRNGDRYEGEFRRDVKHGRGRLVFHDGRRYEGDFENDRPHGKGTLTYPDGSRYVGDFHNGVRHGLGTLSFPNGDVYMGEFRDDARTGQGTYQFADGARYVGEFLHGVRHGRGRYVYPSGEEFVGEFKNGQRSGLGQCTYPTGERFKGLWEEDRLVRVVTD